MTLNAPPEAAVARFCADLSGIIGATEGMRLGMAVSGGGDSLALLLLAHAAFPGAVAAATVDHRLRPSSTTEATFVADVCAALGVPHAILTVSVALKGNRSANARTARYAALDRWAQETHLDWIATGHHADDQLETVIMRLNRVSGVAGLSGIRAHQGRIVRPLLGWRRRELADIVDGCGLTPVDDPSNYDDRYDRARLRKRLADADWLDAVAVSQSAALLAQADAALDWASAQTVGDAAEGVIGASAILTLPSEIARRAVLRELRRIDPAIQPRGDALTRLIAALERGGTMTIGGVKCAAHGGQWRFSRAPTRRSAMALE